MGTSSTKPLQVFKKFNKARSVEVGASGHRSSFFIFDLGTRIFFDNFQSIARYFNYSSLSSTTLYLNISVDGFFTIEIGFLEQRKNVA